MLNISICLYGECNHVWFVLPRLLTCAAFLVTDLSKTVILFFQKQPPDVCYEKGVLKNFAKFTGKHLCQRLSFNEVAGLSPATLLKKMLWQTCFSVNFAKFLGAPFLQNTSGRLLPFFLGHIFVVKIIDINIFHSKCKIPTIKYH